MNHTFYYTRIWHLLAHQISLVKEESALGPLLSSCKGLSAGRSTKLGGRGPQKALEHSKAFRQMWAVDSPGKQSRKR